MAGIQRFVTYIYAYEEGVKAGNSGYAKVEIRGDAGRMELHFSDASIMNGMGTFFFVYKKEQKLYKLTAGKFPIERGSGMANISFSVEQVMDSIHPFSKMDGICIMGSNQRIYLSFWKEIDLAEFLPDMLVDDEKPQEVQVQKRLDLQETEDEKPLEAEGQEMDLEEVEQESLHTLEIPVQNVFPVCDMAEIWEQLKIQKENLRLEEGMEGLKIELKDLRELPKKYWYLGNNSFLLTGLFHYHYLILGRLSDGRWFLGVPGGCSRQERVVAPVFGFSGYLPEGIWYHILED